MKICHIKIENFRTFREFDQDVGRFNVIVGQNNTGKSNLLLSINCFYNPKQLSQEDITKDSTGNRISNEFKIILTYDELNDEEQRNNQRYLQNNKIKILLKGWIDENNNFKYEYHGFIQGFNLTFPPNFNDDLKNLLVTLTTPKRQDVDEFEELSEIARAIQPSGRITQENWDRIKEELFSRHPEIQKEPEEIIAPEKYQGFVETSQVNTIGECIFIPAKRDPSEAFQTGSSKSPIRQLIQILLRDTTSDETKGIFQTLCEKVTQEREQKIKEFEKKFEEELELWSTTVSIDLKSFEMTDTIPINFDIFFNDGVLTDLERKGSGLQRFVFFKFLKISNELRLGKNISLILLFEEPEAHLHPQIQREIAAILRELGQITNISYQIFITTHSPQFIDMQNLDEVFIFNKNLSRCSESKRCSLNLTNLKEFIKTILFFDTKVNEIFFADRIILIEGQSEEITLNFLIQEGKIDVTNISIINAKSKDNIPTFLNVFNALRIPYCVMVDEDPYFLPHYNKVNPKLIEGKRKSYKKTEEIAQQIDSSIGHLLVITPDFDNFLGISQNQIKKLGKPTASFNKIKEIFNNNGEELEKIERVFNILTDSTPLTEIAVTQNGTKWEFKDESAIRVPKAEFRDCYKVLEQIKIIYKEVFNQISDQEREKLQLLFNSP